MSKPALVPDLTGEEVTEEGVLMRSMVLARFWLMLSSLAMVVLTLMKMNGTQMEQGMEPIFFGSLHTSLATLLDYIIVTSGMQLCIPTTLDMSLTSVFNKMILMASRLTMVNTNIQP